MVERPTAAFNSRKIFDGPSRFFRLESTMFCTSLLFIFALDNTSEFPDSHFNEELKHTGNYTDIVDPLSIWSGATN